MDLIELVNILSEYQPDELIFVGLGNEYRTDDGAGLLFFNNLKTRPQFYSSHFINAGTNPENYLDEILEGKAKAIIFIDAIQWGGDAGEISFLPEDTIDSYGFSTHTYSIKIIEQYLLNFRDLKFFYLGIQPLNMNFGNNISANIEQKIQTFFNS